MRFVIAIVLFVVSFLGIGIGFAQRTIWAGPDSITASVTTGATAPLAVIDGAVLNAHAGTQGISIRGDGPVLLAVGRTADVEAWVGDATHVVIGYDAEQNRLTSQTVRGTETEVPDPAGSDLWVQEYTGTGELTRKINAPADVSVLIAADGTQPAPSRISITWPLDNSAPWSGPLIFGGVLALLAGLVVFVWALAHARRMRGPRRSGPRMPKPPKPPKLKPSKPRRAPKELEPAGSRRNARRRFAAAPALAAGLALAVLAGCAPAGELPTPSPTASPDVAGPPTAVTKEQLAQIVAEVAATVASADEAKDAALAETRLAGPALEVRTANYVIRSRDSAQPAPLAIPSNVVLSLPRQTDGWPRSVFAVVDDEDTTTPYVALVLVQDEPRAQYRVHYSFALARSVTDLAPPDLGAPQLDPGNKLGMLAPAELAAAYGDVLLNGEESEFAELFELEGDPVVAAYGATYRSERASAIPPSAKLEFRLNPAEADVIAYGTNDSGQIVATALLDTETISPTEAGAAVNPKGQVKALVNKSQSTRGVRATYQLQLLFYVPRVGAEGERIQLLGYTQALVAAAEL